MFSGGQKQLKSSLYLGLACILLKLVFVFLDANVRLFLGDSVVYLHAAARWGIPPDRSFTYPWLVGLLVRPLGSLQWLLLWQSVAGIATALVTYAALRRFFNVSNWLAACAALLITVLPSQLFFERMVMAESVGLLALTLFLFLSLSYIQTGEARYLILVAFAGIIAISMRLNFVPVVVVICLSLPWIRLVAPEAKRASPGSTGGHFALCLALLLSVHGAYTLFIGQHFDVRPGYTARVGFMTMALVAPLLRAQDFRDVGLPGDFADQLEFDLRNPDTRNPQLWSKGGLADKIESKGMNVERTSRKLAEDALARNPLGLVPLALHNFSNYFRPGASQRRLDSDLAKDRPYPPYLVREVASKWHYDIQGLAGKESTARWMFSKTARGLVALLFLLVPLAVASLYLNWKRETAQYAILVSLAAIVVFLSQVLFSFIASYRYLDSMPILVIFLLASFYRTREPESAPG